jgi:hypothetical protein
VPLGPLAALAGVPVAPCLGGRDPQIRNRSAILGAADFRIGAEVADQNDFVDTASLCAVEHKLAYVAVLVMVAYLRLGAFPQTIDSFYAT